MLRWYFGRRVAVTNPTSEFHRAYASLVRGQDPCFCWSSSRKIGRTDGHVPLKAWDVARPRWGILYRAGRFRKPALKREETRKASVTYFGFSRTNGLFPYYYAPAGPFIDIWQLINSHVWIESVRLGAKLAQLCVFQPSSYLEIIHTHKSDASWATNLRTGVTWQCLR